ncbi:uncharacterized protein KY384_004331 [Bacidia gigantensis]|uniref:uncharacterized protein n=1 Tax=Bacidia gigantensis TaxID=2732470 RepID=UPI001D03D0C4|nr:uncharacterized protein KY384_004331 [Bacidia gigantensis]KAG8530974.1 hypothetical protein KY384_004331 [Bacidia gigantensis]
MTRTKGPEPASAVPCSTTYLESSHPLAASLKSINNSFGNPASTTPINVGVHPFIAAATAPMVPLFYTMPVANANTVVQEEHSGEVDQHKDVVSDPVQLHTWGPKTHVRTSSPAGDPRGTSRDHKKKKGRKTKNGYVIGYKPPSDDELGSPDLEGSDDEARKMITEDEGKSFRVTLKGATESMTSQTVEKFKTEAGKEGTRKTHVTLARITVVEEEVETS